MALEILDSSLTCYRTSRAFVKKKAALTLLRLYRKHPNIVQQEWAERIISLMDDSDMGVTLSVTSLVMALAQDQPEQYRGSYVKAAQRLKKIVVDNDVAPDYLYYKVPCPWIQVKFLRLLQYYPPSGLLLSKTLVSNDFLMFNRRIPCSRAHTRIAAADSPRGDVDAEERSAKQRSKCRSLRSY